MADQKKPGKGVRPQFRTRIKTLADEVFEGSDALFLVAVKLGERKDEDQQAVVVRRGASLLIDGVFARLLAVEGSVGGNVTIEFVDDQTEFVEPDDEEDA